MASSIDLSAELTTTRNRTNYARLCRLIMEGGRKTLRELFDRFVPPPTLASCLSQPKNKQKLQYLCQTGVINHNKDLNKLYPTPLSTVSSANFDITLLMVLFRNICSLKKPRTGWDGQPSMTDRSTAADIVRIKRSRNDLTHCSSTDISDRDFERRWGEISDALVRLGAKERDIRRLKTESMDRELEERYCNEILETGRNIIDMRDVICAVLKQISDQNSDCELHQGKLGYYCETCQILICEDCKMNDHTYHRVIFLKEAVNTLFTELKSRYDKLHTKRNEVADSINGALQCSEKLEQQFADRKKSLQNPNCDWDGATSAECLDKLTIQYDEIKANIETELEKLKRSEEEILRGIRHVENVFMKENDGQFIRASEGASSIVDNALSKPCDFQPEKYDVLDSLVFTEDVELVSPALPKNSCLKLRYEGKVRQIGGNVCFTVDAKNEAGERVRHCTDELKAVLQDPRSKESQIKVIKSFERDVTHYLTFTPWRKGTHQLSVTLRDHHIGNSPFTYVVPCDSYSISDGFNMWFFLCSLVFVITDGNTHWPIFFVNRQNYYVGLFPFIWFSSSFLAGCCETITTPKHWSVTFLRTWFAYSDFNIFAKFVKEFWKYNKFY